MSSMPGTGHAEQFIRTRALLGPEALDILARSTVAVFGLGGVGGYAVEALARSGIGALELVDPDTVSVSNLNRQLFATWDTVGRPKAEVAKERVESIHPGCRVRAHRLFFLPGVPLPFEIGQCSYIIDAVDTLKAKLGLACMAQQLGVPIISCMGTGNKLDPTGLRVSDIYATSVCPLAKAMRAQCRRNGIERLKVVWSAEPPLRPLEAVDDPDTPTGRHSPASCVFVPAAAGLLLAAEAVRDLSASVL